MGEQHCPFPWRAAGLTEILCPLTATDDLHAGHGVICDFNLFGDYQEYQRANRDFVLRILGAYGPLLKAFGSVECGRCCVRMDEIWTPPCVDCKTWRDAYLTATGGEGISEILIEWVNEAQP